MAGMFRPLRADEIEVRIQSVNRNGSGLTLLLYKDARADQTILDETVTPMNWQRQHTRDNANCIVSIWDEKKQQWISKEDTGTESNTEADKGLASDSFKRACFNWGIGRELYTSPKIYIGSDRCNIKDGKCYDRFKVESIDYTNGVITNLVIRNTKTKQICFGYGNNTKADPVPVASAPAKDCTCERCGQQVKPFKGSDGKVYSVARVLACSNKMFPGSTLCAECQKQLKAASNG